MTSLEFSVLGPLEARHGEASVPLGGPKQRTVLAVLLLEPNRVVHVDRIASLVWGEDVPDKFAATLQVYVSNLRKSLRSAAGAEVIVGRRPGYLATVAEESLDLLRFEGLVQQAHALRSTKDSAGAANLFRVALSLWRGPALSDLVGEPAVTALASALDDRRTHVLEECFDTELALGRHRQLVPEIEAAVAADPLRERLTCQLVVALYRSGRQADALNAYRRTADRLADELGIDPGPELRVLEGAVLRQDPVLDLLGTDARDISATMHRDDRGVRGAYLVLPNGVERELGTRTWVIGRHPDCGVVLSDPEASRRHAEIRPVTGGYLLVDLSSTNGTRVGAEDIDQHRLGDGDVIVIGNTELVFRLS